ncbi:MAG: proline dehydrogenase family protein [Ilumatobacteraceae bacterium]
MPSDAEEVDAAVDLARRLLAASLAGTTRAERRRQARLGRLLEDPASRELVFALTDIVLRLDDPRLAARGFASIVRAHRSRALGPVDRTLLRAGAAVAPIVPRLVMPLVEQRIRAETRGIVLPAEDPALARHIAHRRSEGVRLNINPLGEAILSDAEAAARMQIVEERIARPDVDYVSVKISALVANLDALAFDQSLERVCDRLRHVYRCAQAAVPRVFVNLDMEEYRDLELTLQAFMRILDETEFHMLDAGIVLQAYLPDSHDALVRLGEWAARRRADDGGTIKVRLVKGANLAMESVEAELHGWTPAPYSSKAEVDASYKRLLATALEPAWEDAVRIGVASHNLFDIAWAIVVAEHCGAMHRIEIEMLEGMAPAQARAAQAAVGGILMYAPVVAEADFDASIAYLSRRLDENTQPENFLRSLFHLTPNSPAFAAEEARFRAAVAARDDVSVRRRRRPIKDSVGFANEPDGDPTDPDYRRRIADALAAPPAVTIVRTSSVDEVDRVVDVARCAVGDGSVDFVRRQSWLLGAAARLAEGRADAVALMAHEVGKSVREGDPEVSEAIDFCRYYATVGFDDLRAATERGVDVSARGVVVVIGPWNFPLAIPISGIAAALAAGNAVILKPAPEATRIGAWIAEQFWAAGVDRDVLQFVVCNDDEVGQRLVTHEDVETVVLTGSYTTAAMFLEWRPEMRLLAETSGKNAIVVTASADLDLAIADLVRSAFGHAGQKCSAASLGIIEASVYDDPHFMSRLAAAVESLRVRHATDLASMVGPVIAPPAGDLRRALTLLDPGEQWLVEPRCVDLEGRLWSPGVRLGVREGSWFHLTECFGPVLGLMRADDLDHAIRIQNATDYGLTGGIHSLDDVEIDRWLAAVEVGNAYVNRQITGAVVRRQPFGGWKRSSVGGGAKAGGPAYVRQFARLQGGVPEDSLHGDFVRAWEMHYAHPRDASGLRAELNDLRYRPLGRVVVRHDGSRTGELDTARLAARIAGVALDESDTRSEPESVFIDRAQGADRVRLLAEVSRSTRGDLHRLGLVVDEEPAVADGVVELHHWVREQAVSRCLHRHGRLSGRPPAV